MGYKADRHRSMGAGHVVERQRADLGRNVHRWRAAVAEVASPPPPNSDEEWEVEPEEMANVGGFLVWIVFLILVALIGTMVWQYEWILEQMQSLFK